MENKKILHNPELLKEVQRTLRKLKYIRQGIQPLPWQLWD